VSPFYEAQQGEEAPFLCIEAGYVESLLLCWVEVFGGNYVEFGL
jgi:hypothetical protein